LVAALALVALVAGFIGWRLLAPADDALVTAVTDLSFPLVGTLALALAVQAVRRTRLASGEHVAWALLAAALAAYMAGDVLWAAIELSSGETPGASVADVGYLLFYPVALAGLLSLPGAARTRLEKVQFAVDVLVVLVLGVTVEWVLILGPTVSALDTDPVHAALSLAYPIGDLVLLLGVTVVVMRRELSRRELPVVLLVSALAFNLVGDTISGSQNLDQTFATGGIPDICFMLFWLGAGLAMYAQVRREHAAGAGWRPAVAVSWLPYGAMLAAYALAAAAAAYGGDAVGPAVAGAVTVSVLIVARQVVGASQAAESGARAAALTAQASFDALIQQATDVITVVDSLGVIAYCTPSSRRILGVEPGDLIGRGLASLAAGPDFERVDAWLRERSAGLVAETVLVWRIEVGDEQRTVESSAAEAIEAAGVRGVIVTSRDITERVRLEDQLNEARRFEAVGRLAGGVAHEFNNLLTGVGGFAELALADLDHGGVKRDDLLQIKASAERAARITNDLLAFGRRQLVRAEPLDLAEAIAESMPILEQVVGSSVVVATRFATGAPRVLLDRAQLGQALVNLAANARDAMPDGGVITLSVDVVGAESATNAVGASADGESRAWVQLTVSDTGRGMDEATKAHLFEPFFSTKAQAHGGGLGLASVYGIVAAAGGQIDVESAPGMGSSFRLLLPAATVSGSGAHAPEQGLHNSPRSRRVLLVDDDPPVLAYAGRVLEAAGYDVVAFADPVDALRYGLAAADGVDLLVTDVVMPSLTGPLLAERLRARRPGLRTLLISGNPMSSVTDPLLAKPFSARALLDAIERLLPEAPRQG
jgi:PAS domain S-box-containing protein